MRVAPFRHSALRRRRLGQSKLFVVQTVFVCTLLLLLAAAAGTAKH